jgi:phage replication-related protein YjqB (UPF0714/DUF867 family)
MTKYACFRDLERHERPGVDFRVVRIERPGSPAVIVAPHGGEIEVGTSEIAGLVAGTEHSLFCFEGLKPDGTSRDLHITSHLFDHPECVALAARRPVVLSIHGCRGRAQIFVGGLDAAFAALLTAHLSGAGFEAIADGHRYPGRHPSNICNRGARNRGAQLEITHDLREVPHRPAIALAVRRAIAELTVV